MILPALCRLDENPNPLELAEVPDPIPGPGEVLIRVSACGVCHTELDEIEGRTPPPRPAGHPRPPGRRTRGGSAGRGRRRFELGDRVGVAWIYSACGALPVLPARARRTSAPEFRATGRDANGGYAELMIVPAGVRLSHPGRR